MEGEGHGHSNLTLDGLSYLIPPVTADSSYFTREGHSSMITAHIILMILSCVFALPISVMLSIARSRYTNLSQLIVVALNALGLLFGAIYNSNTPDLYENNAHHKIGWIATWVISAQTVVGLVRRYAHTGAATANFASIRYDRLPDMRSSDEYSFSRDSGHGTEPNSPRSFYLPSPAEFEEGRMSHSAHMVTNNNEEKHGPLGNNVVDRYFTRKFGSLASSRIIRIAGVLYDVIDRLILFLAFTALATGIVTYGGHFKGVQVLSGLAHFIKGGIFFWYGLLTLGRVMGSFSDLGWSWNVKPAASIVGPRRAASPSAEFVESLLIFIYGATNVFLEHLGSEDGKWTAADLEHVSLSVMFFGGGLCGMLMESKRIRNILNSALAISTDTQGFGQSLDFLREPKTYGFSTNPMPAIMIFLLGLMMSSHHQISPVSAMMHKQWGMLFLAASLARGVSYLSVYISPPTSYLPSPPPSEVVVAFCLISGGLLFMGSASDIITGMEMYGLHAMFLFTVVMGLTTFLMAWEIVVLAIKGLAIRREQRSQSFTVA